MGSEELHAVVAEACRSYARYWLETFRVVRDDAEFFLDESARVVTRRSRSSSTKAPAPSC